MLNLFSKRVQLDYIGNVRWELEGSVLTLSGSGAIPAYSTGTGIWYSNAQSITKVIIGDGITSIGSYSFENFGKDGKSGITFEVGSGVTSIGQYAFYLCGYSNQGNVNLIFKCPATTISSYAFNKVGELCRGKVDISFTNSSIVTIDTYAFSRLGYKCASSVSLKATCSNSNINSYAFFESSLGSAGSSIVFTGTISKINNQAFYYYGCNSTRPVNIDIQANCAGIGQNTFKYLAAGAKGLTFNVYSTGLTIDTNGFTEAANNITSATLTFAGTVTKVGKTSFYNFGLYSTSDIIFNFQDLKYIDTNAFQNAGRGGNNFLFFANCNALTVESNAFYEAALGNNYSSFIFAGSTIKINAQAFYNVGYKSNGGTNIDIQSQCSSIGSSAFKFLAKEAYGPLTFKANCVSVTIEPYAFNEAGVKNPNVSIILTGTVYRLNEYSFLGAGNLANGPVFIDIQAVVPYFGVSSFQNVGKEAIGPLTINARCKDATFDTSSFYEAGKENKGDVQITMTGTVAKIGKTGFYCAGYQALGQVDIDILSIVPNIGLNAFQNVSRVYINAPRRQLYQLVKCQNVMYATKNTNFIYKLHYKVALASFILDFKWFACFVSNK